MDRDARTLTAGLVRDVAAIVGAGRTSTAEEDLAAHSVDVWPRATKWRMEGRPLPRPGLVVRPANAAQVAELLRWACDEGVPVTPWGLGSSVTGAPLPTRGGIALDMSTMRRILELDERNLYVRVEAGLVGLALEEELNRRGFTLGHSPQSLDRSSVGGWVATRATGQFSSRYGGIEDLLLALTVVLPTGEVVQTPMVPRQAVGPDLRHLFLGAEGTTGVVTEVALRIVPRPERRLLETLGFSSVGAGLGAMRLVMRAGLRPFLVRVYDEDEARYAIEHHAMEGCAMFLGAEGSAAIAETEFREALRICEGQGGRPLGPAAAEAWMARRFDFSAIENRLAEPGGFAETIEVAHFWDQIEDLHRAMKTALAPLADEVLGHFSHCYPQGTSLYLILMGRAGDDAAADAALERIWDAAMGVALGQGAAISHHHGVGLARLPYIEAALGTGMVPLRKVKQALDPANVLNPGKLGCG